MRGKKWRPGCKCIRFTAKSTGRKSVQKVSLRLDSERQVITYTHQGGIQGGGELPGRDLRLGRHLPE